MTADESVAILTNEDLRWVSEHNLFDACYYQIGTEKNTFKEGQIKLRFLTIGADAVIHLNGGQSFEEAHSAIIEGDAEPTEGQTYSIDLTSGLVVTVHSRADGSADTVYMFEYWVEAIEYSSFEKILI